MEDSLRNRGRFVTILLTVAILCVSEAAMSQPGMRPADELIVSKDGAWRQVLEWSRGAKNQVEILPRDPSRARESLYRTQVTTRSPMGAVVFESGGILVDGGWIRILGSGSSRLKRTLPEWNNGKSFREFGESPGFVLVADDAVGGLFAINGGALDRENLGIVYHFAPDTLRWESLGMTYSQFLVFCFSADLETFYKDLRWSGWRKDVVALSPDQAFSFYPFLFTKEGKDIQKDRRAAVPMEEIWAFSFSLKSQTP
jgi:hypothetical protein